MSGFATGLAIFSTCFLLGVLFTTFVWDASLLFPTAPVDETTLASVESYYLTWWNGAMAVKIFLHGVLALLYATLTLKVALWDEFFLFNGLSILSLILASGLYISSTLSTIRGLYFDPLYETGAPKTLDFFTRLQEVITSGFSEEATQRAKEFTASVVKPETLLTLDDRRTALAVMGASNVFIVLLLGLVLALQLGQWYVYEVHVKPEDIAFEAEKLVREQNKKSQ